MGKYDIYYGASNYLLSIRDKLDVNVHYFFKRNFYSDGSESFNITIAHVREEPVGYLITALKHGLTERYVSQVSVVPECQLNFIYNSVKYGMHQDFRGRGVGKSLYLTTGFAADLEGETIRGSLNQSSNAKRIWKGLEAEGYAEISPYSKNNRLRLISGKCYSTVTRMATTCVNLGA